MRLFFLSLFSVLLTQLNSLYFYFFHTTKNMEITRRMSKLDLTPIIIVLVLQYLLYLFKYWHFSSCCFCLYIRTINDGYLIFLIFFFNFIGGILINLVKIDCVFFCFRRWRYFHFIHSKKLVIDIFAPDLLLLIILNTEIHTLI